MSAHRMEIRSRSTYPLGRMRIVFSIINGLLAVLFLVGAAAQINDPDSTLWFAIYALAAATCGYAFRNDRHWVTAVAIATIALLWSLSLLPRLIETGAPFGQIAQSMSAKSPGIEFLREALGLLIISAWMAVLALRGHRHASQAITGESARHHRRGQ